MLGEKESKTLLLQAGHRADSEQLLKQQHTSTVYVLGNGKQIQKSKAYSRNSWYEYRTLAQVLKRVSFQYCYYLSKFCKFCKATYNLRNPSNIAGAISWALSKLLLLADPKVISETLQFFLLTNRKSPPIWNTFFFIYYINTSN